MDRDSKILSFNCGGLSSNKFTEIKHFLDINHIDILCIQETKFKGHDSKNIPGYNIEFVNHTNLNDNVAGGLAIYIKHNVQYEALSVTVPLKHDGSTAIEALAIIVHLTKHQPFVLVNIYSRGCDIQALNTLESNIRSKTKIKKLVYTGDFNAHHPVWGSSKSGKYGEDVCTWMEDSNLVVLNDGAPTRCCLMWGLR